MKMSLPSLNSCITLLADSNVWSTKIGDKEYALPACLERWFAYHIYVSNDMSMISGTIRCQNKHVTPSDINQFIADFKSTHPLEELKFKWSHITHYATDDNPMEIPNAFSYTIHLEKWQEIRLLYLLRSTRNQKRAIEEWFLDYCEKYALTPKYKRDIAIQHVELASTFCALHGININQIPQEEVVYNSKAEQIIVGIWHEIRMLVYILLYVMAAMGLILLGDKIKGIFISSIISLIGWGMICVPLVKFVNKAKDDTVKRKRH